VLGVVHAAGRRDATRLGPPAAGLAAASVVVAVVAGALVAVVPPLALALASVPLMAGALHDARWRVAIVVIGGLLAFDSSAGLSVSKVIYVLLFALALGGAWWKLKHATQAGHLDRAQWRRLQLAWWCLSALVAFSLPVALLSGHSVDIWLRDSAPYLLLASAPLFAADARLSTGGRTLTVVFIASGLLASASFAVYVLFLREAAALPIERLALTSFFLPTALFAHACARGLGDSKERIGWAVLAALVFSLMFATGTRSSLLLLVVLLVALLSVHGLRPRGLGRLVEIGAVAAIVGILAFTYGADASGLATGDIRERLLSIRVLVESPGTDQSLDERLQEAEEAWGLFTANPLAGVGPGHVFQWTTTGGIVKSHFLVDTSLAVLAKFGLIGLAALALFFWSTGRAVAAARRQFSDPALAALLGYSAAALIFLLGDNPFDDKGFALGLLLLLAFAMPKAGTRTS
jgi:O-antigen ligase